MKRCPQCNSVFEDEMIFCKQDGTLLGQDGFSLPSDFLPNAETETEQETVLRYQPINIDIEKPNIPQQPQPIEQPQVNPYIPNHGNFPPPSSPKQNRGCLKYSVFLLIGLIIGGGIVLAILGFGYFYLNKSSNANVANNNTNIATNQNTKTSDNKHSQPNPNVDEKSLNGRIIRANAILRSTPNSNSKRVDTLPKNDRIEIIQRRSSTSKWYEIECEHGSRGWIDGYTIEFTN